jgi:hypothetical protein
MDPCQLTRDRIGTRKGSFRPVFASRKDGRTYLSTGKDYLERLLLDASTVRQILLVKAGKLHHVLTSVLRNDRGEAGIEILPP